MSWSAAAWIRSTAPMALLLSGLAAVLPAPAGAEFGTPFGESEVHHVGLDGFPKWEAALQRFNMELRECGTQGCGSARWVAFLKELRDLDGDELLRAVDERMNALPYVPDRVAWGMSDYWETPLEFLAAGGDCEDYAVAKYFALRTVGIAAGAMRIAVVWDRTRHLHHAVLLVRQDDATLVLDNLSPRIRTLAEARSYVPIYSINEAGWWLHQPVADNGRTLPSLGLDNDAGQASQRVQENPADGTGNHVGGGER